MRLARHAQSSPAPYQNYSSPRQRSYEWNQPNRLRCLANAPYYYSSCATLCGQLVAVGGTKSSWWKGDKNMTTIFVYKETTDSWEAMGDMPTARHLALVANHNGKLMAVGGIVGGLGLGTETDVVEILCCRNLFAC